MSILVLKILIYIDFCCIFAIEINNTYINYEHSSSIKQQGFVPSNGN